MKAAIYLRVSTPAQAGDDKVSLAEQRRLCEELCKRHRWEVVKTYSDEGISGETVEERPQMWDLLIEAGAREFDVVVAYHQDRLARSTEAFAKIGGTLKAAGVKVATCDRGLTDLTMPADRFTFSIFGAVAEYEKERIRERMLAGKVVRARRGEFAFPLSPYGYRWNTEEKKPVPVAEEVEVVREIFRLFVAEGLSTHAIAEVLRSRGIPTRTQTLAAEARRRGERPTMAEGIWRDATVRVILRGRHCKGEWVTWKGPPEVLAKDPPPPAVDEATWRTAQRTLRSNRRMKRAPVRRSFLFGGGMMRCECGSVMTGRVPRPGHTYYACNRSVRSRKVDKCAVGYVPADLVEGTVWQLVEDLATNPGLIAEYAEETARRHLPAWGRELRRVERALAGLGEQLDRARRAYRTGTDGLEEYAANKREIAADREAWDERAEHLRTLIGEEEQRQAAIGSVAQITSRLAARVGAMGQDEKRRVLEQLRVRVTVFGGKAERRIRIEWAGAALDDSGGVAMSLEGSRRPML